MNSITRTFAVASLAAASGMMLSGLATADHDTYILTSTLAGGGATSAGGEFVLSGTIGLANTGSMSGGFIGEAFVLSGGFWMAHDYTGPQPQIPGDLNGDGVVNVGDMLILLDAWGTCPDPAHCPADLNGDGQVNVGDMLILLNSWG